MSASGDRLREEFEGCFGQPGEIGRDPAGGWTRLAWTGEDRQARAWFEAEAGRPRPHRRARPGRQPLGLVARAGPRELRTGGGGRSHLDTVAGGGPRRDARGGQRAAGGGELIGREIGPAGALAAAGSPLCLGSDSNAMVDLFEEARTVELDERLATGRRGTHRPDDLLAAATEAGMAALGWDDGHHLLQVADVPAALTHAIAALDQR